MNLKGNMLSLETFFERYQGVGNEFDILKEDFLLVSFHPVTTEYKDLQVTRNLLQALPSKIKLLCCGQMQTLAMNLFQKK